jgi:metal-responsive CopG/Arc/MetJ family transcriptional regulator
MAKTRLHVNIPIELSHKIDRIIEELNGKATQEDLPRRSDSEIVEMILVKGIRAYRQDNAQASSTMPNHAQPVQSPFQPTRE